MHSLIAKWVSANQRDWDEKLPAVAFAYRTTVHEANGFTPYFLMHGREARLPADLIYGDPESARRESQNSFRNKPWTLSMKHLRQSEEIWTTPHVAARHTMI